jgi:uncharacterized protein (TIGR03643 family)
MPKQPKTISTTADCDRVIQMAWEDRTPFEAIELQFGLDEAGVISLMRSNLKRGSFKLWRERVTGRKTKHKSLRGDDVTRFKSSDQKS